MAANVPRLARAARASAISRPRSLCWLKTGVFEGSDVYRHRLRLLRALVEPFHMVAVQDRFIGAQHTHSVRTDANAFTQLYLAPGTSVYSAIAFGDAR